MSQLTLLFALLLGGILATPVAQRLGIPAPVLCTVLGAAVALIPGMPGLDVPPELILPVLLPPLLYTAARRSSWRHFAAEARPIALLAVVLVLVTTAVVAALAATIHPALPIGAAVVLGTIVSPPDAAAVTTIAGRLGLPRRLVTILEGEGLFNDVTALTLYQTAVAGVLAGTASVLSTAGHLAWSVAAAVGVGLAAGLVGRWLLRVLPNAMVRTAFSLLIPYAAYVPADEIGGSGVLAVLTTAFYLGAHRLDPDDIEDRLISRPFWEIVELMVTALAFGAVGLELTAVLSAPDQALLPGALLITAAVILVRGLGIFLGELIRPAVAPVSGRRRAAVVSWAGMRGVVTIVTALALPLSFPGRDQILFVAVVVVLGTLLLQGLTLPWLIGRLNLRADAQQQSEVLDALAKGAYEAAVHRLHTLELDPPLPDEMKDRLELWSASVTAYAAEADTAGDPAPAVAMRAQVHTAQTEMLAAARSAVLARRMLPQYPPDLVDSVLNRLDLRSAAH